MISFFVSNHGVIKASASRRLRAVFACDVTRLVGSQKQHGIGDVLRRAKAAERGLRFKRLARFFGQGAGHVGVNKARATAVYRVLPRLPTSRASDLLNPCRAALAAA